MILLSAEQSRELDRLSQVKYGVGSYGLMTNAGDLVARTIARRWPEAMARGVLVVAGKGNNGGGGLGKAPGAPQSRGQGSKGVGAGVGGLWGRRGPGRRGTSPGGR